MGMRAHYETQDRIQRNGATPTARIGTVVEDNERKNQAYALFVQNRFLFNNWTLTPGVRVESIKFEINGTPGPASWWLFQALMIGLKCHRRAISWVPKDSFPLMAT